MRKVELRMNEEYKYKIIKKLVETKQKVDKYIVLV